MQLLENLQNGHFETFLTPGVVHQHSAQLLYQLRQLRGYCFANIVGEFVEYGYEQLKVRFRFEEQL